LLVRTNWYAVMQEEWFQPPDLNHIGQIPEDCLKSEDKEHLPPEFETSTESYEELVA